MNFCIITKDQVLNAPLLGVEGLEQYCFQLLKEQGAPIAGNNRELRHDPRYKFHTHCDNVSGDLLVTWERARG